MKIILKSIFFILFGVWCIQTSAQPEEEAIRVNDNLSFQDTILIESKPEGRDIIPRKATMYSAVLPGLGQIYNKQVWKVPFIYGAFAGLGWFINDNHQKYLDSFKAYHDYTDNDPSTTFYKQLKDYETVDETDYQPNVKTTLYEDIEENSKNRDNYILYAAAFYLFNILDANVSAHLIDFDISEDLSCNFEPIAIDPLTQAPIFGATLSYNF